MKKSQNIIVPIEFIERKIFIIRGYKVMIDSDLAELYRVETRVLIQAVTRNNNRFPSDFMFQLTKEENDDLRFQIGISSLKSQFVISKTGRGGRRTLPYVFTEHGVAMLSSVLKSDRAVQMNILIIRAFITLREMLSTHKDLARKIENIERKQKEHGQQLATVVGIVKQLIDPPVKPNDRKMGFRTTEEEE